MNPQPDYTLWLYEGARPVASIRRPLTPRAPTVEDVRELYPDGFVLGFGGGRPECRVRSRNSRNRASRR